MKIRNLVACLVIASPLFAQPPPHRERPPQSFEQRRPAPGRERGQPLIDRWMQHLEKTQPEEHKRLAQLREEDPAAFHGQVRLHLARLREEGGGPGPVRGRPGHFTDHVDAIRNAETDEERDAAKARLRAAVTEMVDQRMQMREERIQSIRTELERLKEQHENDLQRKEKVVEDAMEFLLREPEDSEQP